MERLDVLTTHLLELTSEVPLYAATAAVARLKRLQDRISEALQDGGERLLDLILSMPINRGVRKGENADVYPKTQTRNQNRELRCTRFARY
jgi:hypothetical protein